MRERTHGHAGIDHPGSGEQEAGRVVRPVRRGGCGPRPVRPSAALSYARPDAAPRPAPARGGPPPTGVAGCAPRSAGSIALGAGGAAERRACAEERGVDDAAAVLLRPGPAGPRLLVRRPQPPAPRRGERVRRFMAGLAVVLAAAAVVIALGQIADATAQARGPVVVDVTSR